MKIYFEQLINEDCQVRALYDMLLKRRHKISHQEMPNYLQHEQFVKNHPYRTWHLIKIPSGYIGSFYITEQNTIGVNILEDFVDSFFSLIIDEIKSKFTPLPEIRSIRTGYFLINVAPTNERLISTINQCGFPLVQVSYKIE